MPIPYSPHISGPVSLEKDSVFVGRNDMSQMHFHSCYEIYFLQSGARRYFIGHAIFDVSPGDVILIPPNVLHQTTTLHDQGYERYLLYFYEDSLLTLIDGIGKETVDSHFRQGCFSLPAKYSIQIKNTLEQIAQDSTLTDAYSISLAQNQLQFILLTIFRHGIPKLREQGEGIDKIQIAARYICENYANPISLHDAAQIACLEDTYFSKQFKKLTGFGFQEYLIETRIKAAEQMLRLTNLSINEISERCGFSGSNYFGDVFKRQNGISPSEYRKCIKKVPG